MCISLVVLIMQICFAVFVQMIFSISPKQICTINANVFRAIILVNSSPWNEDNLITRTFPKGWSKIVFFGGDFVRLISEGN